MITIKTSFPIAIDSPDHLRPWGTMRDNSTDFNFINEMEEHFKHKINFLDLGCSGGALVHDFLKRGHKAVGLEGSDYSLKNKRAEWPTLANKNLFTCDISKIYEIFEDDKPMKFDLITAWEVVEHIHPDALDIFFENIKNHLKPEGIFLASVSTCNSFENGVELHQSVFTEKEWKENILNKVLSLYDYPFKNKVRKDEGSFHILLKGDKQNESNRKI